MLYRRNIESAVSKISDTFPVLILTGPRQVGKTTLLTGMADGTRRIVSLDNPSMRLLARRDPELFLHRYAPPVLIDEIQYAPELFDYIKIHADTVKRNGDFWLTGSQSFHMMKNVTESLAGRAGVLHMAGLSSDELRQTNYGAFSIDITELEKRYSGIPPINIDDVFARIFKGSMPRLYEDTRVDRFQYYESYLDTYLSRDIKDLSQVADELAFLDFIRVVAARTATNVNYETLALETGISAATARQWLSLLVSSGLVILIQPYFNDALKRVIKAPRMYFMDTGLCAYMTGWSSPEVLEQGAMGGAIFETWAVSEIYKSYINAGKRPPLYYYRDSNKKEIDLIIYQNGTVSPVEIKKSSSPKDAVKNFSVLAPIEKEPDDESVFSGMGHLKTNIGTGAVISMARELMPIDRKNWSVPAWLL